MYRYEYVNLKGGKLMVSEFEESCGIIDEYAQRGYRFVGYVPKIFLTSGCMVEMNLVFEIEE